MVIISKTIIQVSAKRYSVRKTVRSDRDEGIGIRETPIGFESATRTKAPISRDRITGHDFTLGYPNSTSCPDMLFGGNKPEHLKAWLNLNFK